MPTPAYLARFQATSGVYLGPTRGKSSPKNNRRACLCIGSNTYSRKCCDGALIQQGIGQTQQPAEFATRGGFSVGFSDGFDIGTPVY
jgi:hypothetical protein